MSQKLSNTDNYDYHSNVNEHRSETELKDVLLTSPTTTNLHQQRNVDNQCNVNNYSDVDDDCSLEENYGHETDMVSPTSTTNVDDNECDDSGIKYTNAGTKLPTSVLATKRHNETTTVIQPNNNVLDSGINKHTMDAINQEQMQQMNLNSHNHAQTHYGQYNFDNDITEIFHRSKTAEKQTAAPITPSVYPTQYYISDARDQLRAHDQYNRSAIPTNIVSSPEASSYYQTAANFEHYRTPAYRYYTNITPGERYVIPQVQTQPTTQPTFEYYYEDRMVDETYTTSDDDLYDAKIIEDLYRQLTRALQQTSLHQQPEQHQNRVRTNVILPRRAQFHERVSKQPPISNIYQQPPPLSEVAATMVRTRGGGTAATGDIVTTKHNRHLYPSNVATTGTPVPISTLMQTSHVSTLNGGDGGNIIPNTETVTIHGVPYRRRIRHRPTTVPTVVPRYYKRGATKLSSNGATIGCTNSPPLHKPPSKLRLPVVCQPEWQTLISSSRKQRHTHHHRVGGGNSVSYPTPQQHYTAQAQTVTTIPIVGHVNDVVQHQPNPFVVANNEGNLPERLNLQNMYYTAEEYNNSIIENTSSPEKLEVLKNQMFSTNKSSNQTRTHKRTMRTTSELEALLMHYENLFQTSPPPQENEKSKNGGQKKRSSRKKNIMSSYVQTSRASSTKNITKKHLKADVKSLDPIAKQETVQEMKEQRKTANENVIEHLLESEQEQTKTKITEYSKNESLSSSIENLLVELLSSEYCVAQEDKKSISPSTTKMKTSEHEILDNTKKITDTVVSEIRTDINGTNHNKDSVMPLTNSKIDKDIGETDTNSKLPAFQQPEKLSIPNHRLTTDTTKTIHETQNISKNEQTLSMKLQTNSENPSNESTDKSSRKINIGKNSECKLPTSVRYQDISTTTITEEIQKIANKMNDNQIATELRHSKSYIIKLIDRALSKELGTAPDSAYASPKVTSHVEQSEEYLNHPINTKTAEIESEILSKITTALSETFSAQPHKNKPTKIFTPEPISYSEEPSYIKQLKQLRWGQLKHIQQEIRRLEDLERFLDSCSSSNAIYFPYNSNTKT